MIEPTVFYAAVAKMRKIQKDYFKNKSSYLLNQAKATEGEVDTMLKILAPDHVGVAVNLG